MALRHLLEEPAVSDVFHVLSVEEVACDGRTEHSGTSLSAAGLVVAASSTGRLLPQSRTQLFRVSTAALGSAEMPSFSGRSISRALDKSV